MEANDRVKVISTIQPDVEVGSVGTVNLVTGDFAIVSLDDFTPTELDSLMAVVMGVPDGSIPFSLTELEVI